jgi:hypothetical protein
MDALAEKADQTGCFAYRRHHSTGPLAVDA